MHNGPAIRVYCLGRFRIEDASGDSIARHGQPKPIALLKTLIAHGARDVPLDSLLDTLWPDSDGDAAQIAFTSTLYRLRQLLGRDALHLGNRQLSLDPAHVWWDVNELEAILDSCLESSEPSKTIDQRLAERLIALYRGPFLSGESDPPEIISLRERLHSRFVRSIRDIGTALQENGELDAAIVLLERAAEAVPTAEEICQALMTLLSMAGRTTESRAAYQRLRRTLRAHFDTTPSESVENLRADLERQTAPIDAEKSEAGVLPSGEVQSRLSTSLASSTSERAASSVKNPTPVKRRRRLLITIGSLSGAAILAIALFGSVAWRVKDVDIPSISQINHQRQPVVPDGPSIAVLPFTNMSGDTENNYFADGLTDTLITDLSRLGKILVIARHSAFTYKGRDVDIKQIGRELGVRYVLEGSVQSTGNRLRVNVQLIEAATGTHIWAERFDRPFADVFQVQDEITGHIVEELDVTLVSGEQARAWRRMTRNVAAYSEVLTGRAIQQQDHSVGALLKSRMHFQRAIDLDPDFALPWAYMASLYTHLTDVGYDAEPGVSYAAALEYADRAVKLSPELPIARAYRGFALQQLTRYDEAAKEYELAIQFGPNAAESLMLSAWGIANIGDPAIALPLALRALRLDPVPPGWYWGSFADTYLEFRDGKKRFPRSNAALLRH